MPEGHLHLVRLGPGGLQCPVHQLEADVDPDRTPVSRNKLHGNALGRLKVQKLHGDDQFGTVCIFPKPVAIDVLETDFIQQLIGIVRVVFGVGTGEFRFIEDAGGVHRHLLGHAAAEVDDFIHLRPVDGAGERMAEPFVPVQLPQSLVFVVVVRLDDHIAGVQAAPDVHLDLAGALAQFQQRYVLGSQGKGGKIQLTG